MTPHILLNILKNSVKIQKIKYRSFKILKKILKFHIIQNGRKIRR